MLARKIALAKWKSQVGSEIPADAVTGDLRTNGNALSFWSVASPSREDFASVVLALASAADRVDKLDLTWIHRASLTQVGILVEATEGRTPVESLKKLHFDVAKLDLKRLGRVAELISDAIAGDRHYRWSKKEVLQILAKAATAGELDPAQLSEGVQAEVLALLGSD